jgi:hypothetical protein
VKEKNGFLFVVNLHKCSKFFGTLNRAVTSPLVPGHRYIFLICIMDD